MRARSEHNNYHMFKNSSVYLGKILGILSLVLMLFACSKPDGTDNESSVSVGETEKVESQQSSAENSTSNRVEEVPEEQADTIPDSDVYLATLQFSPGVLKIGPLKNISNNPGYDNQPHFLPDNNTILFTSRRGKGAQAQQSDIYAYLMDTGKTIQMSDTPESEYSPTLTPHGESISVVRVEMDSTQRLWEFPMSGEPVSDEDFKVVFPELERVGYHVWSDAENAFLFVVDAEPEGENHSLEIASRASSSTEKITTKIGRSLAMQPENNALSFIDKTNPEKWLIKLYQPEQKTTVEISPTIEDSEDLVWLGAEHILMAKGNNIYINTLKKKNADSWQVVGADATQSIEGVITRLAVSPDLEWLALVVTSE